MRHVKSNIENPKINPSSGTTLKIIFFTLFLDLVGFSVIFPLFPDMLRYYGAAERETGLFGVLYQILREFSVLAGTPQGEWGIIVLFGGILGSLYSTLQFVFAPFFGILSDRVGRKPVLTICLSGILISYLLWIVADKFIVLLLARFIGGIMSANISTATAVVADITDLKTRSRGMAVVGIAFGLGFIIGPAIGGISASFNPAEAWPALAAYGVNPYSMPAAVAALLTLFNLLLVIFVLPETRSPQNQVRRVLNPLEMLHTRDYPGVFQTNWVNLLFILVFAGMEFSLTFLAADRLGFTPRENAYMFIFVGVVMALVQGGYVRRKAERVGPKRMMLHGLLLSIPSLLLLGAAGQFRSVALLYAGLFVLAVGSGMVTPCLSTLASVYAPASEQGRVLGIFRSLGALGRAAGPLIACVLYWRLGAASAYYIGAAAFLVPLIIGMRLPAVPQEHHGI